MLGFHRPLLSHPRAGTLGQTVRDKLSGTALEFSPELEGAVLLVRSVTILDTPCTDMILNINFFSGMI